MKKFFMVAAMMITSVAAFAQHSVGSFNIQPKIGMNVANLTDNNGSDARIGLAAGIEGEYQATDLLSLSVGAIYSQQGAKYDIGNDSFTQKLDYINVPIMANVYVTKGLAVKLGVQPGFKVNDDWGNSNAPAAFKAKSVDFSIPVGISYEFSNVQLDARYNWGLTKVYDGDKSKNSVFQITLGYKFDL